MTDDKIFWGLVEKMTDAIASKDESEIKTVFGLIVADMACSKSGRRLIEACLEAADHSEIGRDREKMQRIYLNNDRTMTDEQRNNLMKKLFLPPISTESKTHGAVDLGETPPWLEKMLYECGGNMTEEMIDNMTDEQKQELTKISDEGMLKMAQRYVNEIMEICNDIVADDNVPVKVHGSYIFRGIERVPEKDSD